MEYLRPPRKVVGGEGEREQGPGLCPYGVKGGDLGFLDSFFIDNFKHKSKNFC